MIRHLRILLLSLFVSAYATAGTTDRVFDCVVAQDGTGDCANIQDAVDKAPVRSSTPYIIYIKAGRYHEHVHIPEDKPGLRFVGQGRDDVRIYDDRVSGGRNASPVDVAATVVCHAPDTYFEGITFENSWGTTHNDGPQALALYTKNDRIIVNGCAMLSYQDTYRTSELVDGRNYVRNCLIEGAVDFLYGQGNVWFDNCTLNIVRKNGGFIVAPKHDETTRWGYVLMNTTITAPGNPKETTVWLGRPWLHSPRAVFINTRTLVTIPKEGWFDHMASLPKVFADYNTVDADGTPVDLSQRISRYYKVTDNDTVWGTAKNSLTTDEIAQYTVQNVLGGDDQWNPVRECETLPAPRVKYEKGKISWKPVAGARGYIVERGGKVIAITSKCEVAVGNDGSGCHVRTVGQNGNVSR